MSYYKHTVLDYECNDTDSGSRELEECFGSGELEADLEEYCDVEYVAELQQFLLPIVYSLIFVLGIIGNGLVIIIVLGRRRRRSKYSITDLYRLHLSAADLLLVLVLPFWAVEAALADWRFGPDVCVGVCFIYIINLYGSVLILAFISLDRYLAVVRATDNNTQGLRLLLAHKLVYIGAWLPAALLAIPDLIFVRTQEEADGTTRCQRLYPENNAPLWVALFHMQLVLVALVVPGLVLLVCYCVIVTSLTRGSLGGQRQKRRAVRTTIALLLCFFVCWLPYSVGIFVDAMLRLEMWPRSDNLQALLDAWLTVAEPMVFAHCCLNPLLYAFLGTEFRNSARGALTPSKASSLKIVPQRHTVQSTTTESC